MKWLLEGGLNLVEQASYSKVTQRWLHPARPAMRARARPSRSIRESPFVRSSSTRKRMLLSRTQCFSRPGNRSGCPLPENSSLPTRNIKWHIGGSWHPEHPLPHWVSVKSCFFSYPTKLKISAVWKSLKKAGYETYKFKSCPDHSSRARCVTWGCRTPLAAYSTKFFCTI